MSRSLLVGSWEDVILAWKWSLEVEINSVMSQSSQIACGCPKYLPSERTMELESLRRNIFIYFSLFIFYRLTTDWDWLIKDQDQKMVIIWDILDNKNYLQLRGRGLEMRAGVYMRVNPVNGEAAVLEGGSLWLCGRCQTQLQSKRRLLLF